MLTAAPGYALTAVPVPQEGRHATQTCETHDEHDAHADAEQDAQTAEHATSPTSDHATAHDAKHAKETSGAQPRSHPASAGNRALRDQHQT